MRQSTFQTSRNEKDRMSFETKQKEEMKPDENPLQGFEGD